MFASTPKCCILEPHHCYSCHGLPLLTRVHPCFLAGRELVHSIFSLSMATSLEDELVTTCSAGFLCV